MNTKHCSLIFLFLFFQHLHLDAQEYAVMDTSNYHTMTKDVYKALKQEEKKFLEPHIMNAEVFKEIILEYCKNTPELTPEMVMKELNDPKKMAEMTSKLHSNIHEKYFNALADIVDYGFNLKASHYIDHKIDSDREKYLWTYNVQFRIADDKDTLIIKLKSCIHFKKGWYLTEGIKVKKYQAPTPPQAVEEYMLNEPYMDREYQMGEELPPPPVVDTPYDIDMDQGVVAEPVPMYESSSDTSLIYNYVEQSAVYLGKDIRLEIAQKIQYPNYEKELGIQGTVYVQFVIERNGRASEFKILRSVPGSKYLDQEALRILKNLDFTFEPARNNGKVVRSYYNVPIRFVLK